MTARADHEHLVQFVELTPEEGRELLDRQARHYLKVLSASLKIRAEVAPDSRPALTIRRPLKGRQERRKIEAAHM